MNLKEKLTVFIPTHLIGTKNVGKPINLPGGLYLDNEMLRETIRSARSMGLEDVKFCIYFDARFKDTHPEESKKYLENLRQIKDLEGFEGADIDVPDDTSSLLRGNWTTFINRCKTPYMMFLEHDWIFLESLPFKEIIQTMESNEMMGYVKFNRWKLENWNHPVAKNWDWLFEKEEKIDTVPLTKISFFSGWPHIAKISKCRDFYLPMMEKYCPTEISKGYSHLEKDMKKGTLGHIKERAKCNHWPMSRAQRCKECDDVLQEVHDMWGTFMFGYVGAKPTIDHLGDWCRKA